MEEFLAKDPNNPEIIRVDKVFREELSTVRLFKKNMKSRIQAKEEVTEEVNDLVEVLKTKFLDNEEAFRIEPVIEAKQALLISMLFLKLMAKNQVPMRFYTKCMNVKLKEEILKICSKSTIIFKDTQCLKLHLRALLSEVELLWEFNEKYEQTDVPTK
jgi:hypothetical protein